MTESVFDMIHNRIGELPANHHPQAVLSEAEKREKREKYRSNVVPEISEPILDAFCYDLNNPNSDVFAQVMKKKIFANGTDDYKVCTVKLLEKYFDVNLINPDHDLEETDDLEVNKKFKNIYNEITAKHVSELALWGVVGLNNNKWESGYENPLNTNNVAVVISRNINNKILGSVYVSVFLEVETVGFSDSGISRSCNNYIDMSIYISKCSRDNYTSYTASSSILFYKKMLSCLY